MRTGKGLRAPIRRASGAVEVRETEGAVGVGRQLVASARVRTEERVFSFRSPIGELGRYSVQVSRNEHTVDEHAPWAMMNHSCVPSVRLELKSIDAHDIPTRCVEIAVIARRELMPGDIITFDYNTTEWQMAEGFLCGCETENKCTVGGASALPPDKLARWLEHGEGQHAMLHILELLRGQ